MLKESKIKPSPTGEEEYGLVVAESESHLGTGEEGDFNYTNADGKQFRFADSALGFLQPTSPVRKQCLMIITNKNFDNIILVFIILNAIFMALADLRYVEPPPKSEWNDGLMGEWELDTDANWRNVLNNVVMEYVFMIIFTFEMIVKIIGMGFGIAEMFCNLEGPGTYLMDPWNLLDFVVVISGWMSLLNLVSGVSALRMFRVLRPLKSLNALPELRRIVKNIFRAVPKMGVVIVLLVFMLAIFGILGLELFKGKMQQRCRLTPYPVNISWTPEVPKANWEAYSCLKADDPNIESQSVWDPLDHLVDGSNRDTLYNSKESSPWFKPRLDCFWPLADELRLCSFKEDAGYHCYGETEFTREEEKEEQLDWWGYQLAAGLSQRNFTYCGSNFDGFGNPRFKTHVPKAGGVGYDSSVFYGEFNFGYTNFDHLPSAMLTIFQSVTMEGWSDIMYMTMDCSQSGISAAIYFVSMILVASFFSLNLVLAVLESSFEGRPAILKISNFGPGTSINEIITLVKPHCVDLTDPKMEGATALVTVNADAAQTVKENLQNYPLNGGKLDIRDGEEPDEDDDDVGSVVTMGEGGEEVIVSESNSAMDKLKDYLSDNPKRKFTLSCSNIVMILIFINTLILGLDHYGITPEMDGEMEYVNTALTWLFTIECVAKGFVLGWPVYLKDSFNKFDCFIVVSSLVEFVIELIPGEGGGGGGLSVLRAFRLFRLFKTVKQFPELARLMALILRTLKEVSYFLLLVILYIFIMTMLGMNLFGNYMRFDDRGRRILFTDTRYNEWDKAGWEWRDHEREISRDINGDYIPRANFDTFAFGFITVFQVLTGENWNAVMYDCWRAAGWGPAVGFFLVLIIAGGLIVVNLFLAILLSNIDPETSGDEEGEVEEEVEEAPLFEDEVVKPKAVTSMAHVESSVVKKDTPKKAGSKSMMKSMSMGEEGFKCSLLLNKEWLEQQIENRLDEVQKMIENDESVETLFPLTKGQTHRDGTFKVMKSMGIFSAENPVRMLCALLADNKWFDRVVLLLIMASSVLLSIDSPLNDPKSDLSSAITVIDYVFTIAFFLEMVIKIIAMGLIRLPNSYLRNPWNILDFIVVWVAVISAIMTVSGGDLSSFNWVKGIRTLRAFRPLRMINRAPELKIIVSALFASVKAICNVTAVWLLFLLIWSIFAVNQWKGTMRACSGDHFDEVIFASGHNKTHMTALDFLYEPKAWVHMTAHEKEMFGPGSPYFSNDMKGKDIYVDHDDFSAWWNSSGTRDSDKWDIEEGAGGFPLCNKWYKKDTYHPNSFGGTRKTMDDLMFAWDETDEMHNIPTSKTICECWGGSWEKRVSQSFDHVGDAMMTLFEISTTEGWVDVMQAIIDTDTSNPEGQPIRDFQPLWGFLFIGFMFLGHFLFLNLFVGVTIDSFNDQTEQLNAKSSSSSLFLTEAQKQWLDTQDMLMRMDLRASVKKPDGEGCMAAAGRWCFWFTGTGKKNHPFEVFILACIGINTIVMASQFYGEDTSWTDAQKILNYLFSFIFLVECIMKLLAQKYQYFQDNWNIFDFVIVCLTLLGQIIMLSSESGGGGLGKTPTIIRTFRVGRALRLIQGYPELKQIVRTLLLTLPGLANIGALLMLFLFIFSIMGVQNFSTVALSDGSHDENTNLRYFGRSFIVLLRFSTGEDWNGFMHAVHDPPVPDWWANDPENPSGECKEAPTYEEGICGFDNTQDCKPLHGCGVPLIFPYMVLFNVVVAFVFLNLFIGVILEGFDNANETGNIVGPDDFHWFQTVWTRPEFAGSTGTDEDLFLEYVKFVKFATVLICETDPEHSTDEAHCFLKLKEAWAFGYDDLGLEGYLTDKAKARITKLGNELKIFQNPTKGSTVFFKQVLMAFGKEVLAADKDEGFLDEITIPKKQQEMIVKNMEKSMSNKTNLKGIDLSVLLLNDGSHYQIKHYDAAEKLRGMLLIWQARQLLKKKRSLRDQRLAQNGQPLGNVVTSGTISSSTS